MAWRNFRAAALLRLLPGLLIVSAAWADPIDDARQALRQRDYALAERLLLDEGGPESMYQLGRLYQGNLVPAASPAKALEYFLLAAREEHADACYMAGTLYERGQAVAKDDSAARHWYECAAAQGHERAQSRLHKLALTAAAPEDSLAQAMTRADATAVARLVSREDVVRTDSMGRTLLHSAVESNSAEIVQALVDAGADPDALDAASTAPLHLAAKGKSAEVVAVLVKAGARVDEKDGLGNTPLLLAVAAAQPANVKALLAAGASASLQNSEGWSAQMAAQRSQNDGVKQLFGLKRDESRAAMARLDKVHGQHQDQSWSRLAVAAWSGNEEMVQQLLEAGADPNTQDAAGHTPLSRAVEKGHFGVVRRLLAAGASVASDGSVPLHTAAGLESAELLGILLGAHGVDVNAVDGAGVTPLRTALAANRSQNARLLIEAGANPNRADTNGRTPLHLAAQQGSRELVALLLERGALTDVQDTEGRTPLWLAADASAAEVVELLIDRGAGLQPDDLGISPLHVASMRGSVATVQVILDEPAGKQLLNVPSRAGNSPLLLAAERGHVETVRSLVDAGAKVSVKNQMGDTPLLTAVRNDHLEAARLLLESGASLYAKNDRFESAADLIRGKQDETWQPLLEKKNGVLRMLSLNR